MTTKQTLTTLLGTLALSVGVAQAAPLYQQTFDNTTGSNVNIGVTDAGAPSAGIYKYASSTGANFSPVVSSSSFVFYNTGNTSQHMLYWDNTVNIAQSQIDTFSFDLRHDSPVTAGTRFLVEVGGNWFATASFWSNAAAATWDTFEFDFSTANAWVPVVNGANAFDGLMGAASAGFTAFALSEITTGTQNLPTGNITSVGFYTQRSANANTRVDNLVVTAIPEPGTLALVGIALGSLLLFRRRT